MNILFLTNSKVSAPLIHWLSEREQVTILEGKLRPEDILDLTPDLVISYSYRHLIPPAILDLLPGKFINLHISLLPYNRGADPNAWSFLDDTPKGVSIHLIDEGVDTGPILCQRAVTFQSADATLNSTYSALQQQIQSLFIESWPAIKRAAIRPTPQPPGGTYHGAKAFATLKEQLTGQEGWEVSIQQLKQRFQQLPP